MSLCLIYQCGSHSILQSNPLALQHTSTMLSLLPLATLLLHITSVTATPVPIPTDANEPCESCDWKGSMTYESERTSRFGVSSSYESSHAMPGTGGDSGAFQHDMPDAASPSGTGNTRVLPIPKGSSDASHAMPSSNSFASTDPTSTGSANASTPDLQGQDNASSSGNDSTGGVVNPFANANKTVTATMSVNGKDVTVHGVSAMGTDAYLGIPFAAPRTCPFFVSVLFPHQTSSSSLLPPTSACTSVEARMMF